MFLEVVSVYFFYVVILIPFIVNFQKISGFNINRHDIHVIPGNL